MAALILKVGTIAIKQLAKPFAERFQGYIMNHPTARRQAISAAQFMHRMEVRITRGAEGKTGRAFIGDMTEEMSVQLASKLASEGFIFMVGVVVVAFEYDRQRRKEVLKKKMEAAEQERLWQAANDERQRLEDENKATLGLLQQLIARLDELEQEQEQLVALVQQAQQAQQRRGLFGGFFSAKAA